jgi:hypothetical protein
MIIEEIIVAFVRVKRKENVVVGGEISLLVITVSWTAAVV